MAGIREAARRETEARVLAAADTLFRARGFAATTIRDIATSAGVSAGTVIAVGDKGALLVAIFDRLIAEGHRKRPRIVPAGPAVEQIVSLLDPFIELFAGRAELARAYASILVAGSHASTVFTELAATLITELRETLDAEDDALATAIHRVYLGTLFVWAASGSDDASAMKADMRHTLAALWTSEEVNS